MLWCTLYIVFIALWSNPAPFAFAYRQGVDYQAVKGV